MKTGVEHLLYTPGDQEEQTVSTASHSTARKISPKHGTAALYVCLHSTTEADFGRMSESVTMVDRVTCGAMYTRGPIGIDPLQPLALSRNTLRWVAYFGTRGG